MVKHRARISRELEEDWRLVYHDITLCVHLSRSISFQYILETFDGKCEAMQCTS